MITARSSVLNIKPGYYPKISMIITKLINPGPPGDKVIRSPRPLLMTPHAIRNRAYSRAYKKRKQEEHRETRLP